MTDLLPAAGYIRVSTRKQAEAGTSMDEQRTGIAREAERHGYTIVNWYIDGGISGARTLALTTNAVEKPLS